MCRGRTVNVFVERCSRWSYQARNKEEDQCGKRGHAEIGVREEDAEDRDR